MYTTSETLPIQRGEPQLGTITDITIHEAYFGEIRNSFYKAMTEAQYITKEINMIDTATDEELMIEIENHFSESEMSMLEVLFDNSDEDRELSYTEIKEIIEL